MRKSTMSKTIGQETAHTISLVRPHLTNESSLLGVGCGSGWVAATLAHQVSCPISTVDIGDFRQVETADFHVFDGLRLPFPDKQFDVVLFSFVLHHVPDELKPLLSLLGLHPVQSRTLSRWCRSIWQPFARTAFVLEVV